jgi:rubredoxin
MLAKRRCPECTGPNDFLEREGVNVGMAESGPDHNVLGVWTAPRFVHRYRCIRCGHVVEWESGFADPDRR